MRQLNAQHEQLEVIHRLLAELNRLQQVSGAAATGQELPPIAPLNPQNFSSFVPQAYFARGSVLRQGDAGVPEGLTLPEGWTLRPMALAPRSGQENAAISQPPRPEQPAQESDPQPPQPQPAPEAEAGPSTSTVSTPQVQPASSSTDPIQPATSSPKPAEPSSLESSWSFGNVGERNEAEGSGSSTAVAGSSAGEDQSATRRTVSVEDTEDNGQ
jgi:E3 ubiquitin-protein ligase synoviolin